MALIRLPMDRFTSAKLKSYVSTHTTESRNFKKIVRATLAQRWEFNLKTVPLNHSDHLALFAFLVGQGGKRGTFEIVIPKYSFPNDSRIVANPVTTGTKNIAGSSGIDLAGLPADRADIVSAGDFIMTGTNNKVYMVTSKASTDASGNAHATIYPPLMETLVSGEATTMIGIPFVVRLSSDPVEVSVSNSNGEFTALSVDVEEAF